MGATEHWLPALPIISIVVSIPAALKDKNAHTKLRILCGKCFSTILCIDDVEHLAMTYISGTRKGGKG